MSLNKLKPRQTRYGWHPDLPDSRDLLYSAPRALRLPPSADLRHWCSPVEDQGQLGSCTANALAGALELLENKDKDAPFADLSRLFIYYNERVLELQTRSLPLQVIPFRTSIWDETLYKARGGNTPCKTQVADCAA